MPAPPPPLKACPIRPTEGKGILKVISKFLGGTFALQQTVFKERYFKLVGNLLFCLRSEGGEVLSLIVLETCSVQKEDKVCYRTSLFLTS